MIIQYSTSPIITQLAENIREYFQSDELFDDFYNKVWNVETATGFGLDVWGKIVNISREIKVPKVKANTEFFGVNECYVPGNAIRKIKPFDEGTFYDDDTNIIYEPDILKAVNDGQRYVGYTEAYLKSLGHESTQQAYSFNDGILYREYENYYSLTLDDERYRILIFLKILTNITTTTPEQINNALDILFANRGRCYVLDLGGMRMRYVFEFTMENWELSLLIQRGVLPVPAGVEYEILHTKTPNFGFFEAFGDASTPMAFPFDEGTLLNA